MIRFYNDPFRREPHHHLAGFSLLMKKVPPFGVEHKKGEKNMKGNYFKTKDKVLVKQEPEIMRDKLTDILVAISWREIARTYFGKSASWLYHKLDGIDGNGGKGGFSDSERERFRVALFDLSDRIRRTAESI